jgi:hypothetical protein
MLTIHKFYNDNFFSNKNIFDTLGIDFKELNALEKDFLDTLDFDIIVSQEDFKGCLAGLESFF